MLNLTLCSSTKERPKIFDTSVAQVPSIHFLKWHFRFQCVELFQSGLTTPAKHSDKFQWLSDVFDQSDQSSFK